ncbi:MAG: quinoprotein amine dehydrogenase, partial [Alistipes sp.]|nr:quinoprotein amine dehydrogenase [Alistipes sp.]
MKRTPLYILLFVCALAGIRCTEETNEPENIDYEEANYTSYWYYNYEALDTVDYAALGMESSASFNPFTVIERGDTLFVANAGGGSSLIVFDKKNNKPLKTVSTWTVAGAEKTFLSLIEAMAVSENRLYVSERSNLIHVFTLPDMEYYSCIGTSKYDAAASPVCNAQALVVKDGLIFARDKTGTISIYKESDVTPENYQKIKRYKQAGPGAGNSSNNDFAAHYMEADAEGHLMLTGYEAKSIRILDPSLIDDDFVNGTNIDIDDLTWALTFKPKTFAMTHDRLYATGDNNAISIYDFGQKEWVKTIKSVKGFAFTKPERIYREDDETLWVSDIMSR